MLKEMCVSGCLFLAVVLLALGILYYQGACTSFYCGNLFEDAWDYILRQAGY